MSIKNWLSFELPQLAEIENIYTLILNPKYHFHFLGLKCFNIEASIKTNVPLIIHSRNAEDETFDILNNYKNKNLQILMHCFTGTKKFAKKLLTFNSSFSASGIITFKNSIDLQETFKFLPLDKILIETDSPFLAPVPNRGKNNEPSFIDFTAKKLAKIKNISKSELITFTTNNFNKLFFN